MTQKEIQDSHRPGTIGTRTRNVFHDITARHIQLEGVPLASFRARAGAFAIDFLIVIMIVIAEGLPAALERHRRDPSWPIAVPFEPFHSLAGLFSLVLYFALATYLGRGQTLGKRIFRIRVVSLVHHRLSFWHCIERALGYGASALEAGFGFIQYFIHPNRQTVHDRIAETIVAAEPKIPKKSVGTR